MAVAPDQHGERLARRLALRRVDVLQAVGVPLSPLRSAVGAQPSGGGHGQAVEGVVQRLADDFDPVEGADGGEHVGRVGALPAPRLAQPPLAAPRQ